MVVYATGRKKALYLGEVLDIRKVSESEKSWAGNCPYIVDYKHDDNEQSRALLWNGPGDSNFVLVVLNPIAWES